MVDLRATNEKLKDRSQRIIMEVCDVPRQQALELLDRAGGIVKTAIVMHFLDVDKAEAERRMAEGGGVIRRVVKRPPPPV